MIDDVRAGARWTVERAAAARDADLDSLFIGDHHNTGVPYYQNSPMLGRLLAEWGDKPAGALYLLPLWHPVLLAEQVGTLASLASGRFILQCAIGGGAPQFAGMGAELRTRPSRFEAALDIIRRLLAHETVTTTSPWKIEGAHIGPVPPEPVEVWIGAAASPGIDRAARLGDGFLAGPESPPAGARELIAEYREACERHGRTPSAVAVRRDIHVGADDADAARVAGPIVDGGYRGFPPDAPVVGGPERVAETFRELAEMGYTDVIVRHLAEDQAEVLKSFERLAEVRRLVADA